MKDAVKSGKCKYLLCPNFKVSKFETNFKKEVDGANKFDELLLPEAQRIQLVMETMTTKDALSRIPLLHADACDSSTSTKCHEEISANCKAPNPFIVLRKSSTKTLFDVPEFQERKLKLTGYLTSEGAWIPSNQLDTERKMADDFIKQWQIGVKHAPLEIIVSGEVRYFDSYHYRDPENYQLVKYRTSGADGINLIEIGYEDAQACIRYLVAFIP